jgi:hypothetical protein
MLVEDTTAFIEQLEVRREDKRAEKHRRRRARGEVAVLQAEWEARIAAEAARAMEDELSALPEPDAASPGRRLLQARRRRSLEHEIESLRARSRAKRNEVMLARERLRRLDENGVLGPSPRGARVFRLHSAEHHLECSERRFARLASSQADLPVLVARRDGRSWWWYLDRFWWDDQGLTASDVRIFVLDADLGRKQQAEAIAQARTRVLGEGRLRGAYERISQIVRFAVWCRDRGRCVDCGTAENVVFDEILPLGNGGPKPAANVELRCEACRDRRAHNQGRARVSRAQVDATSHVL